MKYKVTYHKRFFGDKKLPARIIEGKDRMDAINKVPNSFQTFKIKEIRKKTKSKNSKKKKKL